MKQFSQDNLSDWAAAPTIYGVVSIFPGVLVIVSLLGMLSSDGQKTIQDAVGYIAAFMRASNAVYDVPEGRPIWKTLPIRVGVTAVVGLMLVISAAIVIFTGDLATVVGDQIGLGSAAVTTWNVAKWPVLLILISLMFAILYWVSPNATTGGFRWFSPGGVFAVILWLLASAAFAIYLAIFNQPDGTYSLLTLGDDPQEARRAVAAAAQPHLWPAATEPRLVEWGETWGFVVVGRFVQLTAGCFAAGGVMPAARSPGLRCGKEPGPPRVDVGVSVVADG